MGFALKKERKSACLNALEFAMATVMLHNNDQDSVKIPKAQLETLATNEIVHYFVVMILSRKKQNTHTAPS